eukprot:3484533-Amphidinium_carterae.1
MIVCDGGGPVLRFLGGAVFGNFSPDGRPSAEVASESIQAIMPDAECRAVVLDIPMPGHPQTKPDVLRSACLELLLIVDHT